MKRVYILHGYTGYPEKNWFPWLKNELEKLGVEVTVPRMPNADEPRLSEWLPFLQKIIGKVDRDTYLIGHSLGAPTILRYLESLQAGEAVGGVVLVSGFAEPIHFTELNNFFETPMDDEKIKKAAGQMVAINSDNDHHVPLWQGEKIRDRFGAKFIVLHEAGHITDSDGFTELPEALEELKQMMGTSYTE